MATRRGKPAKRASAGAHEFTVVVEEMRSQFKVFGEALQGMREQMAEGFDRVDRDMDLLKAAVLEHGRELGEIRRSVHRLEEKMDGKVDRDEVETIVARAVAERGA
jgi:hypothetical protein